MFRSFLARALVALLLVSSAGAALAGPTYRVSVDTASWSGTGYLGLALSGLSNTLPVTATLTNFQGSFNNASVTQGQVSGDIGSTVTLVQGPSFNELLQQVNFGGLFSFDVSFDIAPGLLDGAHFGVALVNADLTAYATGLDGDIAWIDLMPAAQALAWADPRFAAIAEVPEPGSAALVLVALLLVGAGRKSARRRL